MAKSKFSVIIPTLNEEKLLPHLLQDLQNQDFTDFEVIVADAGSKDKTVQIAKRFGAKVVKGGIPSVGRNAGARAATGEYLIFIDADTRIPRDFLKTLAELFNTKEYDIILMPVTFKKFSYENYGAIANLASKIVGPLMTAFYTSMRIFKKPFLGVGIMSIRRDLFEKLNGFDKSLTYGEDRDLIKRAQAQGAKLGFFPYNLTTSARRAATPRAIFGGLALLVPIAAGAWAISKLLKKPHLQSKLIDKGMSKFYGKLGGDQAGRGGEKG